MDKFDIKNNKELVKRKTQDIIENYKDKSGINDEIKIFTGDGKKSVHKHTVPSWLEKGEEWTNPVNGKYWKRDENGFLSSGKKGKKNHFSPKICPKCQTYLKSQNDINVRMQTGKCMKCHSDAEIDAIIEGKEYQPPEWKNDILIKDSMGKVVMNIDEYHQEYGDHLTFLFLNKLVYELDEKRDDGENINELIYENAKERRDTLKERINSQIESMNETVQEMVKAGEISEDMSDDDMEKVLRKVNNMEQNNKKDE